MAAMKIFGFLAASILLTLAGTAGAQGLDLGKREYDANCASCHGAKGRGDGPQAGLVKARVADLSTLARNNNGAFPSKRVHAVIDGRGLAKAHGARPMPVWGERYIVEANIFLPYEPDKFPVYSGGQDEPEAFTQRRVVALTQYVSQLQVK